MNTLCRPEGLSTISDTASTNGYYTVGIAGTFPFRDLYPESGNIAAQFDRGEWAQSFSLFPTSGDDARLTTTTQSFK